MEQIKETLARDLQQVRANLTAAYSALTQATANRQAAEKAVQNAADTHEKARDVYLEPYAAEPKTLAASEDLREVKVRGNCAETYGEVLRTKSALADSNHLLAVAKLNVEAARADLRALESMSRVVYGEEDR